MKGHRMADMVRRFQRQGTRGCQRAPRLRALRLCALGAALWAGAIATAQTAPAPERSGVELPPFDVLDSDGDGQLARPEWQKVIAEPFDDYDADNSGGIDAAEYEVYVERKRQTVQSLSAPSDLPLELQAIEDEAHYEFKRKHYDKAAKLFKMLAEKVPALPEFRFRLAECYFRMGQVAKAREVYEAVRRKEPDNVVVLIAMARLEAKAASGIREPDKKAALLDKARANLLSAARLGANSLKAVRNHPELAVFKDDVQLLVELAKAWQQFEIPATIRDPFINPIPRKDSVTASTSSESEAVQPADRWNLERQRKMAARLKELVAQLREAIAAEDFQKVAQLWSEIEEILRYESSITDAESAVVIRRLKEEVKANESVVQSLLLSAYYATGERLLSDMQEALDAQDYRRLFELWDKLNDHAELMTKTGNEIFAEKARELLARGKQLEQKGRILEEISRFGIRITATVVGGGVAKAIVNNRVLSEGDAVYDIHGNPIPHLRVRKIERRRVRFEYKGLEFSRELQHGNA
ncbi:MAG: tetratricopeptide repeat protein [Planctomycetota bacterium]|nr:MAG: tetratricopeptide repeat protein [Planctomycetota bacterium]